MSPKTAMSTRSTTGALPHDLWPSLTREQRHEVLGTFAMPEGIDQEGLDLAQRWGVRPGGNEWIDLMTRHEIARTIRQNLGAPPTPESNRTTPEREAAHAPATPSEAIIIESSASDAKTQPPPSQQDLKAQPAKLQATRNASSDPPLSSATSSDDFMPEYEPTRRDRSAAPQDKSALAPSRKRKADTEDEPRRSKRTSIATTRFDPTPSSTTSVTATGVLTPSYTTRRSHPIANTTNPTTSSSTSPTPATYNPSTNSFTPPPAPTSTDPKPYKCTRPTCKYHTQGFKRIEHQRRHIATIHDQIVVASCERCGAGFTRKDNHKAHVRMCRVVGGGGKGVKEERGVNGENGFDG